MVPRWFQKKPRFTLFGGEIVWEYVTPFFAPDRSGRNLSNATFRVHRYDPEFSGFTGRDLDPVQCANLNRVLGMR